MNTKAVAAVLVAVLLAVATFAVYEFYVAPSAQNQCVSIPGGTFVKDTVTSRSFGAITEYALPGNDTWPSAVTVSPDGSIWFVEQAVPGVAHLFPNNMTLVEYAWPGFKAPTLAGCFPYDASSAIVLWNGRVWSADEFGDAIYGVNPSDGSVATINATGRANYPYWLAVGPDGDLWVAFDDTPATLGRIFPNLTMSTINLVGVGEDNPLQLDFVNDSLALLSTINLSGNSTVSCFCNGHIYAFNPSTVGQSITPAIIGGGYNLIEPTSVTYSDGRIWVAQHYSSSVVSYDFATRSWTDFPTSLVPWTNTTLPLLIEANGSEVWFNEHYANKMAVIQPAEGTLTELSESNPPITSNLAIQNDEYMTISGSLVWFTSMSGNYVGFVNGSFKPTFGIQAVGTNKVTVPRGGNATATLQVTGTWPAQMEVGVSDSEGYFSLPTLIRATPSVPSIPVGEQPYRFTLNLAAEQKAPPGNYTVAVTLTDGGVQQSAYIFVTVT